jgi:2-oxoisovalerate dehydrogenase E1 component alpha subunit
MAKTETTGATELDAELQRTMYRHMVRSRVLDERMWVLNRQGRAAFWISGMGHEAIQVALGLCLRPEHDWVAPYYRDLGLTLTLGMTPLHHLYSILGRAADPNSGARQMPAHYGYQPLNIISTGSSVATQLLHAAGIALGMRIRGTDQVCVTAVGEGSTSEGSFHEALNMASVHRLPFICVVENNGYAISVPLEKQMAVHDVSQRAQAYGMPGVSVDGGDPIACYHVCKEAVSRARRGEGPTLIEAKVQRLTSHSSDDDEKRYRTAEDLAEVKRQDCVLRFRARLEEAGILRPGDAEEIRAEMVRELDRAMEEAEAAPPPEPESALHHVYGEQ